MRLFEKLKKNKNAKIVEQKFPFYDEPNTAAIVCSYVINRDCLLYTSDAADE